MTQKVGEGSSNVTLLRPCWLLTPPVVQAAALRGWGARAAAGKHQRMGQANRLLLALLVDSQYLWSTYCIQDAVKGFVCVSI